VPPTAAEQANQELVERLIAEGALWSRPLIAAFRATPRHAFLDRVFVYQRKANEWREVLTRDPGPEELRLVYSDRARITHLSPATRTGLQDWGRIGRIGDIAVYFGAPREPGAEAAWFTSWTPWVAPWGRQSCLPDSWQTRRSAPRRHLRWNQAAEAALLAASWGVLAPCGPERHTGGMPRTARAAVGGYCYHVPNRGNERAQVFPSEDD